MKISALCTLFVLVISCKPSSPDLTERGDPKPNKVVSFDYDKIKERGYVIAIMENSSTGLFLYRGETMGYEYELLKMFTNSLGLGLRINIETNIQKAFEKLDKGEGDILAYNLTITKERKERMKFSEYHNLAKLVLIQRKPDGWRQMKLHEIEAQLIRNPVDLIGREVYVRYHSSYVDRLVNLSDEIGGDIIIVQDFPDVETEEIILKVADGTIDFTVVEENIALVNATYYPILDVNTPVSFPQQIAWGLRRNADSLQQVINQWIYQMRRDPNYYAVYDKYFKSSRSTRRRKLSEFSSIGGGKISPYDSIIQIAADSLNWDWRLMAAQMHKESRFDRRAISWAGAVGLMQVLPLTARQYGVTDLMNPEQNLKAAVQHIKWLKQRWENLPIPEDEKIKFTLAAYNVGYGHVMDARRLAEKYGGDPNNWESISEFLIKKSNPDYYNDPVVQYGYCRGREPANYVRTILQTYDNYIEIVNQENQPADSLQIAGENDTS